MVASSSVPLAPDIPPDHDRLPGRLNHQDPEASTLSLTSHNRIMSTVQRTGSEGAKKGSEALQPFKATPEVISQFLELKVDEVLIQMKSVEGREALFAKLMEHEEHLRKIHDFNPEELRRQLEVAGEVIEAKEKYMKDATSPEKKTLFRRAWDRMKGFAWNHPVVTTLLVLALIAGGTSLALYATGNLELVATKLGLGKIFSGVEATGEMFPPVPVTPIPPGAGELGVPPPITPIPRKPI
ncbi:MAG: hypothetical protein PHE68_06270 [Candidatus Peribacteraceae bacterium]|nr:hypothetical protein [Candidatus Peribacteraceae bacterium]MDD5074241.1 hypothetical protein [Candidatus Peribacteraceae bacterium]